MADPLITRDQAKVQLRLEPGEAHPDDAYIDSLVRTATAIVIRRLGRPIVQLGGAWPTADAVPDDVLHALKVIVAELYVNREAEIDAIPAVDLLIGGYATVTFA